MWACGYITLEFVTLTKEFIQAKTCFENVNMYECLCVCVVCVGVCSDCCLW